MKKIRWGIIGTGNIAHSFARDFEYSTNGTLYAVASRSLDKAIAFSSKYHIKQTYGSYKELYDDPNIDVVYIATPNNFHLKNASDALNCQKAVLCEKPITVNPKECKQLIKVAKSSDTYLMEAIWTYFLPPILTAKKWVKEGRIGRVQEIKAAFGIKAKYDPEGRLFNPDLGGGALLDIGIYPIALAWLVYAQMPVQIAVTSKMAKTGVDQEETMIFTYESGAMANLTTSLVCKMQNEAIIIGEHGYISIPDFFMAKDCLLYNNKDEIIESFNDTRKSVGYNFEIDSVNQDLLSGKKQSEIVPLATSLKLQEIISSVRFQFSR